MGADPGAAHAGQPAVERRRGAAALAGLVRDRYQRLARDVDLAVLHALQPPNWGADFLSPVLASVSTTIDDLLAQVRVYTHRRGPA